MCACHRPRGSRWRCSAASSCRSTSAGRAPRARAEWFAAQDKPLELHDHHCVDVPRAPFARFAALRAIASRATSRTYRRLSADSPPVPHRWRHAPATRRRPRSRHDAAAASPRAEIDAFLERRCATLAAGQSRRAARPADLCARRHHEPPAHLGHRLQAAGRHVPVRPPRSAGSTCNWSISAAWPNAARLGWVGRADGPRRPDERASTCQRRPHPDRQGAQPRARRAPSTGRCRRWCMSATRWRRRSTISRPARANSGCSACRPSCSRKATTRSPNRRSGEIARLTRGRLLQVRPGGGG